MLEKIALDSYQAGVIETLNSLNIDEQVKVACYNLLEKNANKSSILDALKGAGKSVGARIREAGMNRGRKNYIGYGTSSDRGMARRLGDLAILGGGGLGTAALGASLLSGEEEDQGLSNAELAALGLGGAALAGGGLYAANEAGLI
mgnify:CR=1 FL=1